MRFIDGGPIFPNELLNARDEGQVIFFCGAGVSRARANLPDFLTLAKRVVEALGTLADSPARRLLAATEAQGRIDGVGALIPADRIFGLLERDFPVPAVRAAVARALKPKRGVDLGAHRTLLDLARGPDGVVRLVTTNFDRLFEVCDRSLTFSGPASLPDPRRSRQLSGIVHLHGYATRSYDGAHDDEFVLSTADFGRAYLSDGWATRFIRALLEKYQLVFVGYTADDPPVHYLLEALNAGQGPQGNLFAFQEGAEAEARALWSHKGVQAIPYDGANGHAALWSSLEHWAERARDPSRWRVVSHRVV